MMMMYFNMLCSTPSLSSIPSEAHYLQGRGLWSTLPALDNISSCHRSAHMDTIWPPSFLSLWPHRLVGTVHLRHCLLLTITYSSAVI